LKLGFEYYSADLNLALLFFNHGNKNQVLCEKISAHSDDKNLNKPLYNPINNSQQKYNNGNFIDSMHHSQIVIRLLIRIRLLENPYKIVSKITHFEEPFHFIVIRHGLSFFCKQVELGNGLS